jgi:glycosyltransferase involved in cell wall biosynthesis
MHRIRMSLPYFKDEGWDAEVVYVDPKYVEGFRDSLLTETLPALLNTHRIQAFPTWLTRKFGLGSLSIRSLLFYFFKVNSLLKRNKYDLIFFSTTMFHVGVLGAYWKRRFRVPFVVDLQDPWRNDYYLDKPQNLRPPKFWFSYILLKWSEYLAIPKCDGVISVSIGYLTEIKRRYPIIEKIPMKCIPFGVSTIDFGLIEKNSVTGFPFFCSNGEVKNVVYVGAITPAFIPVIRVFFEALKSFPQHICNYHFYFLGTSYSVFQSVSLVKQLAEKIGIAEFVTEQTERLPYFETLATLKQADILFIPGSIDEDYSASKVYNAILSATPIFSIFNNKSDVKRIIDLSGSGIVVGFDDVDELANKLFECMDVFFSLSKDSLIDYHIPPEILAEHRTKMIVELFDSVLEVK